MTDSFANSKEFHHSNYESVHVPIHTINAGYLSSHWWMILVQLQAQAYAYNLVLLVSTTAFFSNLSLLLILLLYSILFSVASCNHDTRNLKHYNLWEGDFHYVDSSTNNVLWWFYRFKTNLMFSSFLIVFTLWMMSWTNWCDIYHKGNWIDVQWEAICHWGLWFFFFLDIFMHCWHW